jgi:hypothetical protein
MDIDYRQEATVIYAEVLAFLSLNQSDERLIGLIEKRLRAVADTADTRWFSLMHQAVGKNKGPRSAWEWLDDEVTRVYGERYTGEPPL